MGRVVGEGGFCKVREAIHRLTGEKVAVKMIEKARLVEENDKRRVTREIAVLQRLHVPAVVRVLESIETARHIFVVMEYADGGSLLDYVRGRKRLDEHEARRFFEQIAAGLIVCHAEGVVHRDVKLENILLDGERNMKIIDFGLSAVVKPGARTKLKVHCGSPSYAAPEIVACKLYDGPPVDVWSLGVVLFAMLAGYLPFHAHNNKAELCQKILRGAYAAPESMGREAQDLLRRMLTVDPDRRLTLQQCLQHRWVTGPAAPSPGGATAPPPARPLSAYGSYGNTSLSGFPGAAGGMLEADETVLSAAEALGLDREEVAESVHSGGHNYYSAAYFLLQAQRARADKAAAARAHAPSPSPVWVAAGGVAAAPPAGDESTWSPGPPGGAPPARVRPASAAARRPGSAGPHGAEGGGGPSPHPPQPPLQQHLVMSR